MKVLLLKENICFSLEQNLLSFLCRFVFGIGVRIREQEVKIFIPRTKRRDPTQGIQPP